ncbi:MAG: DNA mismatch repair protein MutS2 [Sphingobacteriales bacterium]|jgi:DNA mismatch repair protein MutS2
MDNWIDAARDLEFEQIIELHQEECISDSGKQIFEQLKPTYNQKGLKVRLTLVREFLAIHEEGLSIPRLEFNELEDEIKTLGIKGSYLSMESILKIASQNISINGFVHFLKQENRFPVFKSLFDNIPFSTELNTSIEKVIDLSRGEVKDDASPQLMEIRSSMESIKKEVARNFQREMRKLVKAGMLSEYQENYVNGRRTLSVLSRYKRDVEGMTLGASKTGSLIFIEPQSNVPLNNELTLLEEEEKQEIIKILVDLTTHIALHSDRIEVTNKTLIRLDYLKAIYKVSLKWNGIVPVLSETTEVVIKNGIHPLLALSNKGKGKKTIGQDMDLVPGQRIMVISGPNAGGKSITLKTIGLLQLMFQCAIPVSVDPNSRFGTFNQILTDIGDNQSIVNELSTYSYRLNQMKGFLEMANRKTMLLLDEFGTGSDPELGGALAEVFFEELYKRKCYGVFTTHYSNIKLKTESLEEATNACMLFDEKNLSPLFQLSIGQAGSSFTFEVAKNNGISGDLIEEAKKKLSTGKILLDKTLSTIQKEKSRILKSRMEMDAKSRFFENASEQFQQSQELHEGKVDKLQEIIQHKSGQILKGVRLEQWINSFPSTKKDQKKFFEDLAKYLAKENQKLNPIKVKEAKAEIQKAKPTKKKNATPQNLEKLKPGSTVRLIDGKEKGTVDSISGNRVRITIGIMSLEIEKDTLVVLD